MNASRSLRRPNVLLAVESLLVVAVLCFVSAIAPVRALVPDLGPDPGVVEAPAVDPCPSVGPSATVDPQASIDPSISPDPLASLEAAEAGLHVDHVWVDAIDPQTAVTVPGQIDSPAIGFERGRLYVVRFQILNDSDGPLELIPVLDLGGQAIPAINPVPGVPFYTSANVRRGEVPGTEVIPVAGLRLATAIPPAPPVDVVPCATGAAATPDPGAAPTIPTADPTADPTPPEGPTAPAILLDPSASRDPVVAAPDPTADPTAVPSGTAAPVLPEELPAPETVPPSNPPASPSPGPEAIAAPGMAHVGINPGPGMSLPGHGFTEVAFTIRATADAVWLATYTIAMSNGGIPIPGAGMATLIMRDSPPVVLSPGQQSGIDVEAPIPLYRLVVRGATSAPSLGEIGPEPLAAGPLAAGPLAAGPLGPLFTSPHGPYSLTTDACAQCHSSHSAQSRMLLVSPEPLSAMCLSCHNGTGASTNIAAQYLDPTVPANDAATGSYYSHAATTPSSHTSATDPGEFAGILNRHSACTDCHGTHLADGSPAIETSSGWTASGALMGASGVAVLNGPAGTAPTYTLKATSAFEYELCFKCHSGFTQLNPQTGGPSTWALDKAVELNPDNLSYHPVEAQGKNQTAQMGRSLSVTGTSPYKLWAFTTTSTIRCVNCHGDSRLANPASPPDAGTRLAPHAVENRGMLIAPLRDRDLKAPSAAYLAADFALCYVCHAEAPFVDTSGDSRLDTRYPLHGVHSAGIASFTGPLGGTVDDDGAGRGNAICAECHFRTHGTTYAVDGQTPASRLVNFAPNVRPYLGPEPAYAGKLVWDAATQSCTLTCHGVNHRGWSY